MCVLRLSALKNTHVLITLLLARGSPGMPAPARSVMPKDTYANTPARRPIRHASPPAGPAPVMCITHTNTKKRNTQAHTLPHLARCSSGRSCSCDGSQLRSTVGTLWDSQAHSPAALPAAAAPDGAAAPAGAREGVGAHGLSASAILWPLGSSSTCCRRTPHKHVHVCARVGGCMRACVREGGGRRREGTQVCVYVVLDDGSQA